MTKITKLRILIIISLMMALGSTALAVQFEGWYLNWLYRQKITIDKDNVTATLTNFPVLIVHTNASSGLWSHAQTNGNDILFTSSDGTTKLSHEIERYDTSSTQLLAWVKVPVLPALTNTMIYMYYGNAAASDQQDATNVWSEGYAAVWHLDETSGTNYDSTANNS